ncbi:stationary phase inducible protein CsiE [Candidatus Sodalis endolongispinus]|uniref:Stationary phase inducible protein CsiE n=1 Tax=Candidatus Sodalis endolongispinus TaxID=2812662 RepID=A0ABS5YA87_9GAMM|nr:stationary phase inducible protein CsiE [Candidatus Sodalis endolongispinus]MBT9431884.1 stationary phase inducible protein CsiE [Candidatus Sodalis endolongispinus]
MSPPTSQAPALSASGRRSHLLLLFYSATEPCSLAQLAHRCGIDPDTVQSDLAQLEAEIGTLYRLALLCREGEYRIEGNVLNHRLCLFDGLRRALRLCPDRVERDFTAALTHQWRDLPPALQIPPPRLTEAMEHLLPLLPDQRAESNRQFLSLWLRYLQLQCHRRQTPNFNQHQRQWLIQKQAYPAVQEALRDWSVPAGELFGLTLLISLLRHPQPADPDCADDRRLKQAVERLIRRFAQLSGRTFSQEDALAEQLFFHLSAALERCHFHMGIDSSLQSEVEEKYPSLLRATRAAMIPLEAEYRIRFSREEMGLIAVIFGAWLMQETDLQEKQVVILSQSEGAQERKLELQIRELTLLPLNIKFQSVSEF